MLVSENDAITIMKAIKLHISWSMIYWPKDKK
jgi:hypothetical protein